jgi:hypothetical protein
MTKLPSNSTALVADPDEGLVLYLPKDRPTLSEADIFLVGVMMRCSEDPDFVNSMHEWIADNNIASRARTN